MDNDSSHLTCNRNNDQSSIDSFLKRLEPKQRNHRLNSTDFPNFPNNYSDVPSHPRLETISKYTKHWHYFKIQFIINATSRVGGNFSNWHKDQIEFFYWREYQELLPCKSQPGYPNTDGLFPLLTKCLWHVFWKLFRYQSRCFEFNQAQVLEDAQPAYLNVQVDKNFSCLLIEDVLVLHNWIVFIRAGPSRMRVWKSALCSDQTS